MKTDFPDVKSYLSVQLFIQDIYNFRKKTDPQFSYTTWSQEIGIKNRSYLRLIITGRRTLSEEVRELFKKHLKLNDSDNEYFTYLVLYSQSKNQEQKKIYGRKLIQNLKREIHQEEIERYYDFVADPKLPKMRTLLSYENFDGTLASMSRVLDIPEHEARASVQKLAQLGLAREHDGVWKTTAGSMVVKDHPGDLALEIFHTNSLQEAIKAQQLASTERRYRSLMMAMNESEYSQFIENFQKFIEDQLSQHDNKTVTDRRLYQMNFNLIPISKKIQDN